MPFGAMHSAAFNPSPACGGGWRATDLGFTRDRKLCAQVGNSRLALRRVGVTFTENGEGKAPPGRASLGHPPPSGDGSLLLRPAAAALLAISFALSAAQFGPAIAAE